MTIRLIKKEGLKKLKGGRKEGANKIAIKTFFEKRGSFQRKKRRAERGKNQKPAKIASKSWFLSEKWFQNKKQRRGEREL